MLLLTDLSFSTKFYDINDNLAISSPHAKSSVCWIIKLAIVGV